jgi:hypothetical protein
MPRSLYDVCVAASGNTHTHTQNATTFFSLWIRFRWLHFLAVCDICVRVLRDLKLSFSDSIKMHASYKVSGVCVSWITMIGSLTVAANPKRHQGKEGLNKPHTDKRPVLFGILTPFIKSPTLYPVFSSQSSAKWSPQRPCRIGVVFCDFMNWVVLVAFMVSQVMGDLFTGCHFHKLFYFFITSYKLPWRSRH